MQQEVAQVLIFLKRIANFILHVYIIIMLFVEQLNFQ